MVFNGFVKVLLQDGLEQVYFWFVAVVSLFLVMVYPSVNVWVNRVYSVNAFTISSVSKGAR